ncbi:MAG: hypothetical protein K2F81_09425 [Ruminococcus sp.]|nr:hypothetical protein [Ruminococcus sp.]
MEKIKKVRPPKNRESDFVLRILAAIIAIIIWVVLSITQYPTTTIQIANVPVVFSLDGTKANDKSLSPINLPNNLTVNVEIKGMKYEIGGYTEKDLIATVNLDPVNNEGTYSLDINVESTHSSDQCTIVSVSPATIDVSFEKINSKTFELSTEMPYVNVENGFTLKDIDVSPSEIEIQGTEKDLENLSKVSVRVKDSLTLSENTVISTSDLIFYDKNNNVLLSDKYTVLNNKNFNVSFSLNKIKDVELKLDFTECPDNFDSSVIPYVLSEKTIQIISPILDSESVTEKSIGSIPLNEVDLDKTFDFNLKLNDDEEILSGSDKISVSFNQSGYTSKNFTVDSDNFKIVNRPTGKKVSVKTKNISGVTIIGPEAIINSISAGDLTVEIDLKGIVKNGTVSKDVTVYSTKHDNIWCYGKYKAEVVIS